MLKYQQSKSMRNILLVV